MTVALLLIGIPITYLLGIGVAYALACKRWIEDEYALAWLVVTWPIVMWPLAAIWVTRRTLDRRRTFTLPRAQTKERAR
jgi:hypothetical protein